MQEQSKGYCHNLLPGADLEKPDEIGVNRARHLGEMMLANFRDDVLSPVEFARKATGYVPTNMQAHMLNAAASKSRLLILNAPGTGASTVAAIFAMHRVVARRNHRVLLVSPKRDVLNRCRAILHNDEWAMIDAKWLFSIHTDSGFWANEEAEWGVQWMSLADLPVHHIPNMVRDEHTIIVDNAHQYTPEFLLLLQAAVQPHQQLILIGRDANRALFAFEHDPEFSTVRARIDQTPLASIEFIKMKREQYRDEPDMYEQIFQMPISWEPVKCPG